MVEGLTNLPLVKKLASKEFNPARLPNKPGGLIRLPRMPLWKNNNKLNVEWGIIYQQTLEFEPRAKKMSYISYDEMLELASLGAKVLQNRSVELAKKLNVKIIAKSSFSEAEGTVIGEERDGMETLLV